MVKSLFFELRKKDNNLDFSRLDESIKEAKPRSVSIASTIQYLNLIPPIKKYIESRKIKVLIKRGPIYTGHILGCNSQAFDKKADMLLLLADGKFHAVNNAIQSDREIYIFNTKTIDKISKEEIEREKSRIIGKIKKYLSSDIVGFIISTKPGQNNKNAQSIIKKIKRKSIYIFESDNINASEFENFNLPIYINSACPGLSLDNPKILNISDILHYI
jgi:diphthamide biosynthesis enzyme Dph1/Dph2-like protein